MERSTKLIVNGSRMRGWRELVPTYRKISAIMEPAATMDPNTTRASKSERISVIVFTSLMSNIARNGDL